MLVSLIFLGISMLVSGILRSKFSSYGKLGLHSGLSGAEIAEAMLRLNAAGIDGILLNWIDPLDGIARFNAEVLPILEREGARAGPGRTR